MALNHPINVDLSHQSINPEASTTILLIHGALSSGKEWDLVALHLQAKYHLLIPDLPRHCSSSSVAPLTIEHINRLLAHIIRTQAKNGVAHIVGLSLGAHIVAHFSAGHPDLVLSVFATGLSRFTVGKNATMLTYAFYGSRILENAVPHRIIQRLLPEIDFNFTEQPCTVSLVREIIETMGAVPEELPKRTLIIAAAKGGFIPTNDNLEDAKYFGKMARRGPGGEESLCVKHDGMRHAWNRQDPDLFARAVKAWVEKGQVLNEEGFENLLQV